MPNPATSAAPRLSAHLGVILDTLCRMIAAQAGRQRSAAPIVLLLWPYLRRLAARFDALARRAEAGAMPARPRLASVTSGPRAPGKPRLPRGVGWLRRLAPETAPIGGQLRHLLTDPDMAALLAASPQAGRLLRPLCRMLGIRPDPDLPPALFPAKTASPSPSPASPLPDPTTEAGRSPQRPRRGRRHPPWPQGAPA